MLMSRVVDLNIVTKDSQAKSDKTVQTNQLARSF